MASDEKLCGTSKGWRHRGQVSVLGKPCQTKVHDGVGPEALQCKQGGTAQSRGIPEGGNMPRHMPAEKPPKARHSDSTYCAQKDASVKATP
jgi:hypothetical protein